MQRFILSHPLVRPLYGFLKECLASPLEKTVLDCGAGGDKPPLALFSNNGFTAYGIDTSYEQIELAHVFAKKHQENFTIVKGDVCDIPLKRESMSFIYSINTFCHLSKKNVNRAVKELDRVVRPHGILFVNFASVDDVMFGEGIGVGKGEFIQEYDWYPGIVKKGHICSYYEDEEPDRYFNLYEIVRKEKRIIELPIDKNHEKGGGWQTADICYTLKKEG